MTKLGVAGGVVACMAILSLAGFAPSAVAEPEMIALEQSMYPVGSIVVVNKERRLYLIGIDGQARRYPVAVGNSDEQWTGRETISEKKENPRWIEPDDDGEGEVIEGGDPKNPLGKRALYLGRTLWRIHGTIAPKSIGKAVSNGCIRMLNDDVIDLYERVAVGTDVYVVDRLGDRKPELPGRKVADN